MNRKIKFRALRTDGKGWVYGSLSIEYNGSCFISYWFSKLIEPENNFYEMTCKWHEVIPETVGQFTGLKDKNGTEIYEGDMFTPDTDNEEVKAVVRWDEDSAKFVVDSHDSESSICDTNDLGDMILEYCEVIGSIHTTHDKGKEESRED